MTTKITTTPSPLEVVDKINAVIDDATNLSTTVGNKLDKTGTAASATTLSGLTATVTELNYVDGVTSNIQTQLNGKLSTSGKAASATKADTATTAGNVTGTVAVANGGTGATTATKARTNLGLSTAFTAASISGKVITLTKADGTTTTLTTQDTNTLPNTISLNLNGAIELARGTWTSTGNGIIINCNRSNSGWTTSSIDVNSVRVMRHRGKESGWTFTYPVIKGDVVVYTDASGYNPNEEPHSLYKFIPWN